MRVTSDQPVTPPSDQYALRFGPRPSGDFPDASSLLPVQTAADTGTLASLTHRAAERMRLSGAGQRLRVRLPRQPPLRFELFFVPVIEPLVDNWGLCWQRN